MVIIGLDSEPRSIQRVKRPNVRGATSVPGDDYSLLGRCTPNDVIHISNEGSLGQRVNSRFEVFGLSQGLKKDKAVPATSSKGKDRVSGHTFQSVTSLC